MSVTDNGPAPNAFDIETETVANQNYRTVAWTGKHLQVLPGPGDRTVVLIGDRLGLDVERVRVGTVVGDAHALWTPSGADWRLIDQPERAPGTIVSPTAGGRGVPSERARVFRGTLRRIS